MEKGSPDTSALVPPQPRKELGFGEGVCTCAGCMRKAPPIREDSSARIAALTTCFSKMRERQSSSRRKDDNRPQPTDRDKDRATALMAAVEAGTAPKVEELLCEGIPCDTLRAEAATELILTAAQLGHPAVINTLCRFGADLEVTDDVRGGRPLMHAATNGHATAAVALLKNGADREARDWNGYTALMIAVFSDRSTTAAALLEYGAQVDAVDDKGRTSLCHAARYGSTDCIHVLAEHGADVFAVDEDGLNPLDIAEQNGRLGAAGALRKLEQRQRLQDKRLLRQKLDAQGGSSGAANSQALSKEQADRNMEALLRELEEDNHRQQERKAAKKAKKKGKLTKKKGPADDESQDSSTSQTGLPPNKCTTGKGKKSPKGAGSSPGDAGESSGMPTDGSGRCGSEISNATQVSEDTAAQEMKSNAAKEGLREQWTAILDEAVCCKDLKRLRKLSSRIAGMMASVAEAGVSIKYGKKVLQKLGKVAPAKAALDEVMARPDSQLRPSELQAAVEAANAVRRHLDNNAVAAAEARLQRLLQEQEEAKWAKLKAELGVAPKSAGAGLITTNQVLDQTDLAHSENECIVCLAASKDAVLIPCGHICMCFDCSKQVQANSNACPICRATIDHAFQVL
mmetsp:Transcript_1508/g.4371  ORF Transcript_1508/g.4371 Transcript_1508/m.4371 type:complete len:628 (-) Transcript_1508:199-2082(-)